MQNKKTPFQNHNYSLNDRNNSMAWFAHQTRLLRPYVRPVDVLGSGVGTKVPNVVPGSLYLFLYDAKTKDKLPYWDQFPLIFPFRKEGNDFWGLNFHYLPPNMRYKMLSKLLEYRQKQGITEQTRLRLSWGMIKGVSKYKPLQNCVKHYLMDHVYSSFLKISPLDWPVALLLPCEQFVGANKHGVWRNKA